jgi:predicted MFS family arabinose efflux permease
MPALVDGLEKGLGFSARQAGLAGSFNVYGAACGAFLIAFFIRRVRWRAAAYLFLAGMIAMDLVSIFLHAPAPLFAVRFLHGFMGGMLVGLAFSIIARTRAPDRSFGVLLLLQVLAGGLGVMTLPLLTPHYGTSALFLALIAFSLATLAMARFIPDYPEASVKRESGGGRLRSLIPALIAVFLFQAANMGLFAYIIGLGESYSLQLGFVSRTLGIANWLSIAGAGLVIVFSTRYGILWPILGGIVVALVGTAALYWSGIPSIWIASNVGTGVAWNFVISHQLGMCARLDSSGRAAVWSGFASKMGLASGPLLASFIVGRGNYGVLIATALGLLALSAVASSAPALTLDRAAGK